MPRISNDEKYPLVTAPADGDTAFGQTAVQTHGARRFTLLKLWEFFRAKLTANPVTIAEGGTGAATAAAARTALGVAKLDLSDAATQTVLTSRKTAEALYVFPSFSQQAQRLQILASGDGVNFKLLGGGLYNPPTNGLRDPSFFFRDGWCYMAHTNVDRSTYLGNVFQIVRSRDFVNWEAVASVTATGKTNAWSPDWHQASDGTVRIVYSASSDGATFSIFTVTATADDFSTWSAPTEIYSAVNAIDPFLIEDGGVIYLWYKREDTVRIEIASATSFAGPFTAIRTGDWAGWPATYEGPSIVRLPSGRWRLYADRYIASPTVGFSYAESDSLLSGWSAFTDVSTNYIPTVNSIQHGTVARLTLDQAQTLIACLVATSEIYADFAPKAPGVSARATLQTIGHVVLEKSSSSWAQRTLWHIGASSGTYKAMHDLVVGDSWQVFRGTEAAGGAFLLDCTMGTKAGRWYGAWRAAFFQSDQQALSGAGAVDIVSGTTLWTTTGANAGTLANGVSGQRKTIIMVVDGGDGTLTPTTKTGYSTITFTAVGQSVTLEWVASLGWVIESKGHFAPTIA